MSHFIYDKIKNVFHFKHFYFFNIISKQKPETLLKVLEKGISKKVQAFKSEDIIKFTKLISENSICASK